MNVEISKMEINYKFCVFCQQNKREKLKDPRNLQSREQIDASYASVDNNLNLFKRNNKLARYQHLNSIKEFGSEFKQNGAKWHKSCRLKFSISKLNKSLRTVEESQESLSDQSVELTPNQPVELFCPGLVEVITSIENWLKDERNFDDLLYLKSLYVMYCTKLTNFRGAIPMNKSRFKDEICQTFPNLKCFKQGREIVFSKREDKYKSNILILQQSIEILRESLFPEVNESKVKTISQEESVPNLLLNYVEMLLYGVNVDLDDVKMQAALTITQLIVFNSVKKFKFGSFTRHSKTTPLTDFIATSLYAHTGKKNIIDDMKDLGMSIGYPRVLQIYTAKGNDVIEVYKRNNVVCPPHLPKNNFVTCAVDNIDHNPSSNTSKGSFHGTAISINTHLESMLPSEVPILPTTTGRGSSSMKMNSLPTKYTFVKPVYLNDRNIKLPDDIQHQSENDELISEIDAKISEVEKARTSENLWLQRVEEAIGTNRKSTNVSWSAFHANRIQDKVVIRDMSGLLPLFVESVESPSMICHTFELILDATQHLNPGQPAVLECDQPVFAVAKKCQWAFPEKFGEDKIVVMLGGLHIEMTLLKCIGNLLDGSEWHELMADAGIATLGTAANFIKAGHVKRARYAHEVTCATLTILRKQSFSESLEQGYQKDFESWIKEKSETNMNFKFWNDILEFERLIFLFVRSIREGNIDLYVEVLEKVAPWLFAIDHTHYSHWIPVHIRDMKLLIPNHPTVYAEFKKGKFVFNKTTKNFSSLAIDHNHEQHNAVLKGEGGIIGKFDNHNALLRWMVAGPEIVTMIREFEAEFQLDHETDSNLHHEQSDTFQFNFVNDVKALLSCFNENDNPFSDECVNLIKLKSRVIIGESGDNSVRTAKLVGEKQYKEFVEQRLVKKVVGIMEVVPHNHFNFFKDIAKKKISAHSEKVKGLQADLRLVSRLLVATQTRSDDDEDFFQFENQPFPPALSINGKLRTGQKSDILSCLQQCYVTKNTLSKPKTTCSVLDGPCIVNMVRPAEAKTFSEYALQKFKTYLTNHYGDQTRVDVVFDVYKADSLKASLREKRGEGQRQLIKTHGKLPTVWSNYLRVDENKNELFTFLAKEVITNSVDWSQLLICTTGITAISNKSIDLSDISPCDHEEADSRVMVHVRNAVLCGHKTVMIQTVDSDVVAIAVRGFNKIDNITELWIAFGTGKSFRYIPAHEISVFLGPERSNVLPLLHALSGADTTSALYTIGKLTAWNVWLSEDDYEYTRCFQKIIDNKDFDEEDLKVIEKFIIKLYDKKSTLTSVNEARKVMFEKKNRFDSIPPTLDALIQHLKRAIYQASLIWCRSETILDLPSPVHYGWKAAGTGFEPHWISELPIASSCRRLKKCGCKLPCQINPKTGKSRCKCAREELECSPLCTCTCIKK